MEDHTILPLCKSDSSTSNCNMTCLQAKVVDVRTFGCWLKFELEEDDGTKLPLHGLAHKSDMGWGPVRDARRVIKVKHSAFVTSRITSLFACFVQT